jgi:outer membrane receptor protein involved in Fe transport
MFKTVFLTGVLLAFAGNAFAGTTGKLGGRVVDAKGQPLPRATVIILGQRLGAEADAQGRYAILNVPAGTYDVKVQLIGYKPLTVQRVEISADKTTSLDAQLEESALTAQEVVIVAKKPVVDVKLTSSVASVNRKEIAALPVQELQDVVNLQAGVVDGHIRGGRLGEVQYQVGGVSVNNVFNNAASVRVDRSLLEEVQVISGTFDAEYGQAMSGVVNAVLKKGTPAFQWGAELFAGGYAYPGAHRQIAYDRFQPTALQNYELHASGPTGLPQTVFLASGRRYISDDYVYGVRRFVPTDTSDFAQKIYRPTGDEREEPLGYSREWSGLARVTNHSLKNIELDYQAVFNVIDGRRSTYAFRLNPEGLTRQRTFSLTHGLDWTHTLGRAAFYKLSFRQNYFTYKDLAYDDVFDPRYDQAGPPIGDVNYELGAYIQGVDFTRFRQSTNAYLFKGSLESQATADHHIKLGGEVQLPLMSFGAPGYLVYTTVGGQQALVRHSNEPPDFPGIQEYRPVLAAGFGQDEIEWKDLTVRAGARLDYFDARSTLPSDLANPANAIAGAPVSLPRATSRKVTFAPRLGVSYPVTERAGLFFAYGHFYQYPALGEIFTNADYSVLAQLQAGGISYGVLGNPDIKPERTVQYQFGYKNAITDFLGLDVNVFYKDIRDLLGVEFISTYNGAEYARLTNVDFGSVIGVTVSLDQRQIGLLNTALDYTWQIARGNSSDPRETATRASAGEDPRPRELPLAWDQRHTLNMTATLSRPDQFTVSAILHVASGQPYTPTIQTGFGGGLETNSGRKPASAILDIRAERDVRLAGLTAGVFGRVFNALDARYRNGFVFSNSGSPYYSRYPAADQVTLADPTRFYPPRRIEVGLTFNTER